MNSWAMSITLLERSIARIEIEECIVKYCHFFDSNQPQKIAKLFTEMATVDYGPEVGPIIGLDAIVKSIESGLTNTFTATSHHVSNFLVDFESGDVASMVCYLYAWHTYKNRPQVGHLWGQYHLQFQRVDGIWKIDKLVLKATGMSDFHRLTMYPIGRN
jgi:hypothetical protein